MKKRFLSLLLALCLVVGLLPNLALSAFAAVTTRTIQSMKGTEYEMTLKATSDGATVSYTKNQEITLTNEETGETYTEWVQVPADESDWNAKYYYNTETERFTLEMKGVKVTMSCTFAFGVNDKTISTQGGEMEFVITQDSYFENCVVIANRTGGSYRWSHTYVTSQNGATLYVDNSGKSGAGAVHVFNSLTINANITAKTKTYYALYAVTANGKSPDLTINGGNLDLQAAYIGSGKAYFAVESDGTIQINGGNISAVAATKAFGHVPQIAEDLCYAVTNSKGEAITVEQMNAIGKVAFNSFAEHTAGQWVDGKAVCTVCGAAMECAHEYKDVFTKVPTCTAAGETIKTCAICGVTGETVVVEALPHLYVVTDGEVVDGAFERTHTCSACGDTYSETVKVMSSTVTLFGTAVTVDTDATTAEIPEALYWVNGEEGALPVAATVADNWNYRFSIVANIPTVTIRNADFTGAASFLYAKYDGSLKLVYEGTNNIKVPYVSGSTSRYFISYSAATNTAGKGHLYIEAVEDAVLNVTGGDNNASLLGLANKAYLTINGGTINMERTNAGGVYGVLSATYGKVAVNNCNLNLKDLTAVSGKHPLVSIGNGNTYGLTITDSNVTLESNAYITLCMGVFQSNLKGVLYHANVTVNGDSNVKIINSSINTSSTYDYSGVGIWARAVNVKGGSLEVEGAQKAIHLTVSNSVPGLADYDGDYEMFTAKDGAPVTEYAVTTYFKVAPPAPCEHEFDDANDATCNKCEYTRPVADSLTLSADNKLVFADPDATNLFHRVVVYYLGGKTVSDITLTNPLLKIDPNAKTTWGIEEINKVQLLKGGNYVVHLFYNTAGSDKVKIAKQFTVETMMPTLELVDGYKLAATAGAETVTNYRATVYYVGDRTVTNIYDEAALKAMDANANTYWGLNRINTIQFLKNGKYIVHLNFNIGTSAKQTVAAQFEVKMSQPTVWMIDGVMGTEIPADVAHRTYYVYFLGDQTVEDIYDEAALKAIDATPTKFDNQKQVAEKGKFTEAGNYVIILHYNYAGSAKMTLAVSATI